MMTKTSIPMMRKSLLACVLLVLQLLVVVPVGIAAALATKEGSAATATATATTTRRRLLRPRGGGVDDKNRAAESSLRELQENEGEDDGDLGFPRHYRRQLPLKQKLNNNKQQPEEDDDRRSDRQSKFFLKRKVLHCDRILDLDNCWNEISHMGEHIRLVHHLVAIHSLAIETDESTMDDLATLGFDFSEDMERETLALEGSLQYHNSRSLAEQGGGGQQTTYGFDMIRASEVWKQYRTKGEGVRVCIMDTGVYAQHPDFEDTRLDGWNSTEEFVVPWSEDLFGHGTFVTGVIAASDNDQGFVGVAPGVDVYFIRVFTNEGKFYGSDVVAAAEACRDAGADLISMSLGGTGFDDGEHDIFQELYLKHGIIAVAAAGNTGGPELIYPASYNNVVSVTACSKNKKVPDFSTFNSFVDIAAPGVDITSTYIGSGDDAEDNTDGAYASLSGTSMAAPYVIGTLALMKSYAPEATADELLYALTHSTQALASNMNLGIVDAFAAIQMLEMGVNLNEVEASSPPCLEVELSIATDQWGEETAYRLRKISNNAILWKGIGLESYMEYMESTCVDPNDCYEFIIRDTYGDGIVEPGRIQLVYGDQVELDHGGFGLGGKILFGDNC